MVSEHGAAAQAAFAVVGAPPILTACHE